MGLKKNSPGCNCCDAGFCLNNDSTKYTGVEISGAQQLTATLAGTSFTGIDPNGVYLWSARNSDSCTIPSSWRLGNGTVSSGCCQMSWRVQTSQSTLVDSYFVPAFSLTRYRWVEYIHILLINLTISSGNVRLRMNNDIFVSFVHGIDATLAVGARITTLTETATCGSLVSTYTATDSSAEIQVYHDDTITNSGVLPIPYTSTPTSERTRSMTATWDDCSGGNTSNLSSNRTSTNIDWGFAT